MLHARGVGLLEGPALDVVGLGQSRGCDRSGGVGRGGGGRETGDEAGDGLGFGFLSRSGLPAKQANEEQKGYAGHPKHKVRVPEWLNSDQRIYSVAGSTRRSVK